MTFGSLFAGIGGMDLGLERAGMTCAWQVEIDDYANRVLEKHWPNVRRWRDVRNFPPGDADEWRIDCIAGGFPCQDISNVGDLAGIEGKRSGLWAEFSRIVCVLRPRFVLVENVAALLGRGLGRVLGDLSASGYDAEWGCIPACALGATHHRERLFIVGQIQHAESLRRRRAIRTFQSIGSDESRARAKAWLQNEPAMVGMDDGVPNRVDRLRGLGNAVVPQVAEWIGRRIMEAAVDASRAEA